MNGLKVFLIIFVLMVSISSLSIFPQTYIADYKVSKEIVLRTIPDWAITAAKNNLHILYCGTSHSTQTVDGMRGLMEYKTGDYTKFAFTYNGSAVSGSLDIHYNQTYGTDLSNDALDVYGHTSYFRGTVEYLDNNSEINVVMWSWCAITSHDVQRYLDNFQELINMYKAGGSKGRTVSNEVKFVFMTGYASGIEEDTPEPPYIMSPYQNHKRIIDFCNANNYFCLDYWSQDTYHYETDFYKPSESGNDNIQHKAYFDSHDEGLHWFATRSYIDGSVKWPAHCEGTPQHITSNRRAYGAWWIWARLAGWDGSGKSITVTSPNGGENWEIGSFHNITWSASSLTNDVKLTLWKDDALVGLIVKDIDPSTGTFSWTVGNHSAGTAAAGSGYKIKVREQGGVLCTTEDSSDTVFTLTQLSIINVSSPNGNESWQTGSTHNITWSASGLTNDVKLTLWKDGALVGLIVKDVDPSSGSYSWTVGNHSGGTAPAGSGYKIKIREQGGASFTTEDLSNTAFNISQLIVTSPDGGENWTIGNSMNITWSASGLINNVKLTLWKDGTLVGLIVKDLDPSSGTYSWTAGNYSGGTASAGTGYKIKIREQGGALFTTEDISNIDFSLNN